MALDILLAAALAASTASPERIRIGMDVRSAPWAYIPGHVVRNEDLQKNPAVRENELSRLEGLDVDVMRAVEKQLGVRFDVVPASWFLLEQGLLDRKYDLMIGSWTPSLGTSPAICASPPYCSWGLLLVVRLGGAITSPLGLEGRRLGHYRDPSVEAGLRALGVGLGSQMLAFDDGLRLFDALKAGEVDAAVYDSTFVRWYMARNAGFRVLGEPLNQLGYHIGARGEDAALCARIGSAIAALRASGELDRIRQRWEAGGSQEAP